MTITILFNIMDKDMDMELSKKTTILFSKKQFALLKRIAASRNTSIGDLIRKACEENYGLISEAEAETAVDRLSQFSLPVSDIEEMKQEILQKKPGLP